MKNNKFTNVPPLVDNNITVQDPTKQSNIFNNFFASKSTVNDMDDPIPFLQQKEGIQIINSINTSPIEVARFIRNIKRSKFSQCGISGKFIHLISPDLWKLKIN